MNNFRWLLNWSIEDIFTNNGDVIPVFYMGRNIGNCTVSIEGNQIIGNFLLNEELDNNYYVLYVISLPNRAMQRWLEGIAILPPAENLAQRARTVADMREME